jgi:hypothetical protein
MLATALLQMKYNSTTNHAGNAAALFFIVFYQWSYGFFIDPTQFAYAAEIFPTVIRAKGIGLAFFSYFVGAVTYTKAASTAFREIGWRMHMVWFALLYGHALCDLLFRARDQGPHPRGGG